MKKKLNCAVIGCGIWGEAHCEIFNSECFSELVAVADINLKNAKKLSEKYSVVFYQDYNKMLENEDIDAVGIATPDFAHAEPIIACAKKHKDILCEKPLVTNNVDLERVIDVINKNNIRVMVDYHNRYNVPFSISKEKIKKGILGKPINAYMRLNDNIFVPISYLSWAEKSSIIWFLGSHAVDTVMYLFDDKIKRVYSIAYEGVLRGYGINAVDTYMSSLEFEKGGIAQIENGWITPNTNPLVNDFKFNMLLTNGMINIDISSSNFFEIYYQDKIEHPDFFIKPYVYGKPSGFAFEAIRDFVKKLYLEEEFLITLEESINVNKVLFAILKSANKREPVFVKY